MDTILELRIAWGRLGGTHDGPALVYDGRTRAFVVGKRFALCDGAERKWMHLHEVTREMLELAALSDE